MLCSLLPILGCWKVSYLGFHPQGRTKGDPATENSSDADFLTIVCESQVLKRNRVVTTLSWMTCVVLRPPPFSRSRSTPAISPPMNSFSHLLFVHRDAAQTARSSTGRRRLTSCRVRPSTGMSWPAPECTHAFCGPLVRSYCCPNGQQSSPYLQQLCVVWNLFSQSVSQS